MGELFLRRAVVDIFPENGAPKRIDGLRIKFKIEKNLKDDPNCAEISIFNTADDTNKMLLSTKTRVALSIGYLGLQPQGFFNSGFGSSSNVDIIFIGNIKKFNGNKTPTKFEGLDIVTKVELSDGGNAYRNARHDKGYPPGTTLKFVLADVVSAMGFSKSFIANFSDVKIANGIALSGLVKNHLDTLTRPYGLEWSIQDETLQITVIGQSNGDAVLLLTPETGLIGIPNQTDKGLEVKSLVQPQLRPGRKLQVKSKNVNGVFKIERVIHEGDTYEGEFLSTCECTKLRTL